MLRLVPPTATQPFARVIDAAVLAAAEGGGAYPGALGDGITCARARLPPHLRGLGLRSLEEVADGAYVASFVEAAQSFFGTRGLFPSLIGLFRGRTGPTAGLAPAAIFAAGGPRFHHFFHGAWMTDSMVGPSVRRGLVCRVVWWAAE